jgi:hypothetical protein
VDFVAELPIRLKTVTNLNIINRQCPSIKNCNTGTEKNLTKLYK